MNTARVRLQRLERVLGHLPPATWTTYGDLAAVVGSHPRGVGVLLRSHDTPRPWRVLDKSRKVREGFTWGDPTDTRDPVQLLRDDGVRVGADGKADAGQRLPLFQLRGLLADEASSEAETAFRARLGEEADPDAAAGLDLLLEQVQRSGCLVRYEEPGGAAVVTSAEGLPLLRVHRLSTVVPLRC